MIPVGSLIVLILDIYVIFQIISSSADAMNKLIWILVVLVLPVIGAILYLLMGRGAKAV